jgi:3-deoxy-manno-octulosonate cytidylyltransferase (CMP-KDO synthetase)
MEGGDVHVVIPARYGSTRFPGKPLVKLKGRGGIERTLVEWTWRAATASVDREAVVVATDDDRIISEVENFGGKAMLTPDDLRNGTERCAWLVASLAAKPDLVINFQGDAPLIPPYFVKQLIAFARERKSAMATPYVMCDAAMAGMLRSAARDGKAGGTCAVADKRGRALYFSKYPIPFGDNAALKMHIGLYAYTPDALATYLSLPPSAPELAEGLEQLRFLDCGIAIDLVELALPPGGIWELNNPSDVAVIELALAQQA